MDVIANKKFRPSAFSLGKTDVMKALTELRELEC